MIGTEDVKVVPEPLIELDELPLQTTSFSSDEEPMKCIMFFTDETIDVDKELAKELLSVSLLESIAALSLSLSLSRCLFSPDTAVDTFSKLLELEMLLTLSLIGDVVSFEKKDDKVTPSLSDLLLICESLVVGT